MLEGFLDDSKKNPSNRQDLAFYWNFLKDDGISVTTTYQQMLMKLGILDPVVYHAEVSKLGKLVPEKYRVQWKTS
jgi:hypothetical protein